MLVGEIPPSSGENEKVRLYILKFCEIDIKRHKMSLKRIITRNFMYRI